MGSITAEQLQTRLLLREDLVLVNVLPKKSFDKEHIRGSISVSQYDEDFLDRIEFQVADADTCLVVYCNSESCNASNKAATKLVAAGYTDVLELRGGLAAWRAAGYPLGRALKP